MNKYKYQNITKMRNQWISLNLPEYIRKNISEICNSIKEDLLKENIVFNPMEYDDLHMTLVFMGKTKNDTSIIDDIINNVDGEHNIQFDTMSLFPPAKQNLLVLKYKNNNKLTKQVIDMKEKLHIVDDYSFEAHITLGKIKNKKVDTNNELYEKLIKKYNQKVDKSFLASGCYLCGEI